MQKAGKRQKEAAEALGISAQALGMWMKRPGAPVDVRGKQVMCLWPDFPRWREKELEQQTRKEAKGSERPASEVDAERRKKIADAVLAELAVAKEEGVLISLASHEQVVGEFCERIRAVLVNAPSNYLADLEREGVDPKAGQRVLEKITQDLTLALRESVDDDDPQS